MDMRRQCICFHRESGKISNIRAKFIANKTILLGNDLPPGKKKRKLKSVFKVIPFFDVFLER